MNVYKLVSVLLFLYCIPLTAQNWNQTIKSIASIRGSGAYFGNSVSVNGGTAVIGALYEETDASGNNALVKTGAVYIFENNNDNWIETKKIVAPDRRADDNFGNSVSISGDFLAVAASGQDYDTNNANPVNNAGAIYIFGRNVGGANNWGFIKKLVAFDRALNDFLGNHISLQGDNLVVGASAEDDDEIGANFISLAGSAYIFSKNQGGINNWGLVKKIVASDRALSDQFGYNVAIDGDIVVVGAFQEDDDALGNNFLGNAGSAYVFYRNQGGANNWGQVRKIVPTDRETGDFFGNGVSISGTTIAIAAFQEDHNAIGTAFVANAGSVYIFEKNQGGVDNWGQAKKVVTSDREPADFFGRSISLNGDILVGGAVNEDEDSDGLNNILNSGSAYVYSRNAGGANNWGQVKKITASDRGEGDLFGLTVATNGTDIVVGAMTEDQDLNLINNIPDAGAAYFYKGTCSSFPIIGVTSTKVITHQPIPATDYYNTNCALIATVTGNGTAPINGHTFAKVWIDGIANPAFVRRHYEIAPTQNLLLVTGTVKLYFTQNEFDVFNGLNTYKLPASPTDVTGIANLRIRHYTGTSATGSGLPASYGSAATELINPTDSDIVWNAAQSRWEVSFATTGFGGFFVQVPPPSLIATSSVTPFSSCVNIASPSQTISIQGTYLLGNISVTAPAGYQISLNATSGYSNALTILAPTGFATTTVYVTQLSPTAGPTTGTISFSSTQSNTATIAVSGTVLPNAVITQEPTNANVCFGNNALFTAIATGTNLGYQWQINNGSGYTNIIGATATNLAITLPPSGNNFNGSKYRLIVTSNCVPDTSNEVTLSVLPTPVVTITANRLQIKPGETATLTATSTTGTGTFTWYKNDSTTILATGPTLSVNISQLGSYKVTYSSPNACTVTSYPVVIEGAISTEIWAYPNPSKGVFQIRYFNPDNGRAKAVVYDAIGNKVYEKPLDNNSIYAANTINISNQPAGIYLIAVTNKYNEVILIKRIVITR